MMSQPTFSQATPAAEFVSEGATKRLTASVVSIADLRTEDKSRMLTLMRKYYDAVTEESFQTDLARKNAVILLRGRGAIQGFSTLVSLRATVNHKTVYGVFSGDTVIEKQYWGQTALPKAFLRYMFKEKLKRPFSPLYWLLISKGYKTYLMMANNFAEHFPRYEMDTPADRKAIAEAFYLKLFPEYYNPATGLIRFPREACRLKIGVSEISDEMRASNPRIAFFEQANPEWRKGVELASLARMTLAMPFRYAAKAVVKRRRIESLFRLAPGLLQSREIEPKP
ncbi:MAG: hypothetical protein ACREA2_22540 [Blastocatellia bacterium]